LIYSHFEFTSAVDISLITLETDVHRELPTDEQIIRVKAFSEMLS
jgi:hypothetical protein